MGKIWDTALAFVEERLPELVGDFFGPRPKWIVIISKFIIVLCIEDELLAMAGPLLRSLLFLFLFILAIVCIEESEAAQGMAPKLSLWVASVAPFWLGLCGSLVYSACAGFSEAKFKDPAAKWWIVFATYRSGLSSAVIPTSHSGEMLYVSVASLACIFGSVPVFCICSAIFYCIALLFPYLNRFFAYVVEDFISIALYSIALLVLIAIIVNGKRSKDRDQTWGGLLLAFIICIFAPFWLSWCASLWIWLVLSNTQFVVPWFIVFIGQRVILYILVCGACVFVSQPSSS